MTSRLALFLCGIFSSLTLAIADTAPAITVKIVNNSGVDPGSVYLLLHGNAVSATGITADSPTLLSALTNNEFTLSSASAGRLYISFNGPVAANESPTSTTRFDKVEFTYPGAGNLTAVDFFGIPLQLTTLDASGNLLQNLTFYTSKNTLAKALTDLAPGALVTANGQPSGPFVRVLSPVKSPSSYPSMQSYVSSLSGTTITIDGTYVGFVAPSPNTYNYTGTFASDGSITLSGTMTAAAVPNAQNLTVDGATLADAIYTCNGAYNVATAVNNPQNVSNNDVYAAIYAAFFGGFNFGYIGGKDGASSSGWYGTTPYHPPYAAARSGADGYYNQYASLIAANSDAYGFPFSDLLQPVQVALNPGGTGPYPVATLVITILPDNALDAPIITSSSVTNSSITVNWGAVTGATSYTVHTSPPLPAQAGTPTSATSATIGNLSPGTPYTVAVSATNGTATSPAMPVVITTSGTPTPVTGAVTWHFIPNFTGTFAGDKITFNGETQTLPNTANPALQFNNVTGVPGQQNAYVFKWTDANDKLIDSTVLYVTLDDSPATGMGSINHAAADTFMAANQNTPTYDGTTFNLYLSIQPTIQRTVSPATSPGPPNPDANPAVFAPKLTATTIRNGHLVRLEGVARDADGIARVSLVVITQNGKKKTYIARLHGKVWTANVRRLAAKRLKVKVIVEDGQGNLSTRKYKVKVL
jgi:hypothetical protein